MAEDDPSVSLDLIARIYAAAMDRREWGVFLDAIEALYPGSASALWFEDVTGADVGFMTARGIDAAWLDAYAHHYAAANPWTRALAEKPAGRVHTGDMLVPRAEVERSGFFHGFLRPQNLHDGLGVNLLKDGARRMHFGVLTPARLRPGGEDLAPVRRLAPHLGRAAALHRRFARLEARATGAAAMLDRLELAALLVDDKGTVAEANAAATDLLATARGLTLRNRALVAADPRENARLQGAIARATATASGRDGEGGSELAVTRPSGKRPFALLVAPLFPGDVRGASLLAGPRPAAAVFIRDPDRDLSAHAQTLGATHGLTPAETRLVGALISEGSLTTAAARTGITHETARSQLKAVLEKTGTCGQVELVRLALAAGGAIGPAGRWR